MYNNVTEHKSPNILDVGEIDYGSKVHSNDSSKKIRHEHRKGRGLFDGVGGSQSSPLGSVTRLQPNPFMAASRVAPLRANMNSQMLKSGSGNSLRKLLLSKMTCLQIQIFFHL